MADVRECKVFAVGESLVFIHVLGPQISLSIRPLLWGIYMRNNDCMGYFKICLIENVVHV